MSGWWDCSLLITFCEFEKKIKINYQNIEQVFREIYFLRSVVWPFWRIFVMTGYCFSPHLAYIPTELEKDRPTVS